MKDKINAVVSNGAEGLKVQWMGLSCGEARSFFEGFVQAPPGDITEVWLYEKLKAAKSRRFTIQHVVTPPKPIAIQPVISKVAARLPKIIRRGR